jgi:aspartate aminotransferase
MIQLSESVQRVRESATMAITARAQTMKRAGEDVIAMAAGEPDFDTPPHIVAAAKQALDAGFTRYTPASGISELREAWARQVGQRRGVSYGPNQLIVSAGGKPAIFNVVYALVNAGDEVIIPAPYWVSYPEQVRAVGGVPVVIQTTAERGFKVRPDELRSAMTPRTRLFILNSPSNPTALTYGVEFSSIASLGEKIYDLTIIVGAVSKTYAMTGWRIGYAAGPAEVIAAAGRYQSQSASNPNSIAQKAALAAITGDQSTVEAMRREFDRRRKVMVERLCAMPGLACPEPQGAFYVFPRISHYYGSRYDGQPVDGSMAFCKLLLEHEKVATVPGVEFGADDAMRLSYATSMAAIEAALSRLERFLDRLD